MMKDFKRFKEETNKEIGSLSKQYRDEISRMNAEVDNVIFKGNSMSNKQELIIESFKIFEKQRKELTDTNKRLQE